MMGPVKACGEGRLLQDPAMSALRCAWTPDPDAGAVVRGSDEFDTGRFKRCLNRQKGTSSGWVKTARTFQILNCS